MADYKELLDHTNQNNMKVFEVLPKEMKGFMTSHDAALEDKVLNPKTKELIALAIGIAVKCEPCIVSHVGSLIELGASREEIAETVGVALFMGGGPALVYGGKALEAFDQLSK